MSEALDELLVAGDSGDGSETKLLRTHPGYRENAFYPLISPRSFSNSNGAYRHGSISFFYFQIHESVLIKNFWIAPRTTGTNANFAIYQIENGSPTNRLHALGQINVVDSDTSIPFNKTLDPEFYAFAYTVQNSFQNFIAAGDILEPALLQGQLFVNTYAPQRRLDATFSYSSNMPNVAPAIDNNGSIPIMVWMEV